MNVLRELLVAKRNVVVLEAELKQEPFREIRRNGGRLTEQDWERFDAIELEMNIALGPIDKEIFLNGWM